MLCRKALLPGPSVKVSMWAPGPVGPMGPNGPIMSPHGNRAQMNQSASRPIGPRGPKVARAHLGQWVPHPIGTMGRLYKYVYILVQMYPLYKYAGMLAKVPPFCRSMHTFFWKGYLCTTNALCMRTWSHVLFAQVCAHACTKGTLVKTSTQPQRQQH